MSFPEASRRIVLSPRAKQDFIDILRYTGETWGPEQLHPSTGSRAPELPETHRLYFIGSHVIIYRTQDASIAVVRILHQRMSLIKHL
jgi:toxin ParE1/3/4